jgi:hypothetical protein
MRGDRGWQFPRVGSVSQAGNEAKIEQAFDYPRPLGRYVDVVSGIFKAVLGLVDLLCTCSRGWDDDTGFDKHMHPLRMPFVIWP